MSVPCPNSCLLGLCLHLWSPMDWFDSEDHWIRPAWWRKSRGPLELLDPKYEYGFWHPKSFGCDTKYTHLVQIHQKQPKETKWELRRKSQTGQVQTRLEVSWPSHVSDCRLCSMRVTQVAKDPMGHRNKCSPRKEFDPFYSNCPPLVLAVSYYVGENGEGEGSKAVMLVGSSSSLSTSAHSVE